MTRVVWVQDRTMCWDQRLLNRLLPEFPDGPWRHETYPLPHDDSWINPMGGAVVIVPARFWSPVQVQAMIARLPWVVLILTSDEESTFDHTAVEHQAMRVWVMTPQPGVHEPGPRYIGEGPVDVEALELHGPRMSPDERPRDVQFAGQVTHERRQQMIDALMHGPAPVEGATLALTQTAGFTQGMPRDEYLQQLAESKIVLAPSGPATPDSFRLYEALEAGAVPIADGLCPRYPERGYWDLVYPEGVPFPVVYDWADELAKTVDYVLGDWRRISNRCQAWWIGRKRRLANDLVADVLELAPTLADPRPDQITVLLPTSPTSGGPAAAWHRLSTTVASIRERLPTAEIIIMCDGVRAEQEHMRGEYEDYLGRLMWACQHEWHDVLPLVFDHHAHQANITRAALEYVRTSCVLFVEHDMPLVGEIPFEQLVDVVRSGFANVIRLGQDREREQYRDLMLDQHPTHQVTDVRGVCGEEDGVPIVGRLMVPLVRTVQWSQRPHVASTGFYRQMLGSYFGTQSRTMIEDVMHGVVQNAWHRHGQAGWEQYRVVFYAPGGDEARSRHIDGRGDDPKFDMVYAYDGPPPEGAPAPTPTTCIDCGHLWSEHGQPGCLHVMSDDLEHSELCRCTEPGPFHVKRLPR